MSFTNVKSNWVGGNLVFYDKSDNIIFTIDGANRSLVMPSGAVFSCASLDLDTTEMGLLDGATAGSLTASKVVTRRADYGIPFKTAVVVAKGSTQGTGQAMTADLNLVTTADNTTCVVLPTAVVGMKIRVVNTVANKALPVFPATGAAINGGSANAAFTMGAAKSAVFVCTAALTWYADPLAAATATVTELNYLAGLTAGTQAASKAVVPNSDVNIGVVKATELHIGATGTETQVTATGGELNYVDVTTAGTVEGSKAVILDANKHQTECRISAGGLYFGTSGSETQVTATAAELNYLDIATLGTAAASKALVLDAKSGISFAGLTPSFEVGTGRDNAFLKIGTWATPMSVALASDHWVPIQVNLSNTGNAAFDIAAARFRVDTGGATPTANHNCLQLRQSIGHSVAQAATLQASASISGATTMTGEFHVGYFATEGSGVLTHANTSTPGGLYTTVLMAVNRATGAQADTTGLTDVAVIQHNAATTIGRIALVSCMGTGATIGLDVDCNTGTLATGIAVTSSGGTVTTGVAVTANCTTGLSLTGAMTTGISVTNAPNTLAYTSASATPGTVRTLVGNMTTHSSMSSGNLVGVRGTVTMAGGNTGGYLYGAQGKATTGANAFAGTVLAGLYGQIDVSGGTITSGHVAAIQANIYGANSGSIPMEGIYVEHAGGGVINAFLQCFGKSDYVFDVSSNTHTQMSTTGSAGATASKGWLKVLVDGSPRYIPLTDSVT